MYDRKSMINIKKLLQHDEILVGDNFIFKINGNIYEVRKVLDNGQVLIRNHDSRWSIHYGMEDLLSTAWIRI